MPLKDPERRKQYARTWREANREKLKASGKIYRDANKEKIKAWREANKEKVNIRKRAYYEINKEKFKAYREANKERIKTYYSRETIREKCLRRLYQMSIKDYDAMYDAQEGKCAICKERFQRAGEGLSMAKILVVDHCHSTGQVRKLLCTQHNLKIGIIEGPYGNEMLEYLKEWKQ